MHLVGLAHDAHDQPYFILKTGGAPKRRVGVSADERQLSAYETLRLIRRQPQSPP